MSKHSLRQSNKNTNTAIRVINRETLVASTTQTLAKGESLTHFLGRLTHLALEGNAKRVISKIENLRWCKNLKVLYLYDNRIERIENLEQVPGLTHLYLQHNCLRKLENLSALKNLRKLHLDGNQLSRLEGLEELRSLEELYISNQRLPRGTSFSFDLTSLQAIAPRLKYLTASNCNITSVADIQELVHLEKMDLSENQIVSLEETLGLIRNLRYLSDLNISNNPVMNLPKAREQLIVFSQRSLTTLNKKAIDSRQRMMMQSHQAHIYRKQQEKTSLQQQPSSNQDKELLNLRGLRNKTVPKHLASKMQKPGIRKHAGSALATAGFSISGFQTRPC